MSLISTSPLNRNKRLSSVGRDAPITSPPITLLSKAGAAPSAQGKPNWKEEVETSNHALVCYCGRHMNLILINPAFSAWKALKINYVIQVCLWFATPAHTQPHSPMYTGE